MCLNKETLRAQMLNLRRQHFAQQAGFNLSNKNLLAKLDAYLTTCFQNIEPQERSLGLYWPLGGEVDTRPLWGKWWRAGWQLYLPTILPGRNLCFGQIHEDIFHYAFGQEGEVPESCYEYVWRKIVQVKADYCQSLNWSPRVLHVPGLAFTTDGERLGHGGGYYDRFLEKPEVGRMLTVSTVFDYQLKPTLPIEKWDRKIDCILIERESELW